MSQQKLKDSINHQTFESFSFRNNGNYQRSLDSQESYQQQIQRRNRKFFLKKTKHIIVVNKQSGEIQFHRSSKFCHCQIIQNRHVQTKTPILREVESRQFLSEEDYWNTNVLEDINEISCFISRKQGNENEKRCSRTYFTNTETLLQQQDEKQDTEEIKKQIQNKKGKLVEKLSHKLNDNYESISDLSTLEKQVISLQNQITGRIDTSEQLLFERQKIKNSFVLSNGIMNMVSLEKLMKQLYSQHQQMHCND